jgi:hypothetical protein
MGTAWLTGWFMVEFELLQQKMVETWGRLKNIFAKKSETK